MGTLPVSLAIDASDVTLRHPGAAFPVMVARSFQFVEGMRTALVGPNGSGKSTLLKAAAGLIPVEAGEFRVLGRAPGKGRKELAYVPQRTEVDWSFPITVAEVVLMGRHPRLSWWGRQGPGDRRAAHEALDQVGLTAQASRPVGELSGGQQQRTFLARAIAQDAELMLWDEPFAGLDATSEAILHDLLHWFRNKGKTIVVATHDIATLSAHFDEVVSPWT